VLGTVTFYFATSSSVSAEGRSLLRVVADQMAATAEKARLIDDLQRANTALHVTNAELAKQYAELVEARRTQDEFLSNVSHELRTPLTAVLGYLAIIEEGLTGPVSPEQQETLKQVKTSSEKLLELIGDLLELSSLKKGEQSIQTSELDPREPFLLALSTTTTKHDDVKLVVDDDAELPPMRSDKRKIARILTALLNNAFKFTEKGEVRVVITSHQERIVYQVRDTGVGISKEAQRFVFDEFRQEDGSATRKFGGSGVGLAIALRLARMLGGDITLSSEQGKGSTFTVELPLQITGA
jgi:signal transduction histidine kinase